MSKGCEFLHNLHSYHYYSGVALALLIRLPDAAGCYSPLGAVTVAIRGCYFRYRWEISSCQWGVEIL